MPSVSKSQQRLMGACSHGSDYVSCPKHMSTEKMKEFARTPTKGLPNHVRVTQRHKRFSKVSLKKK